MTVQFRIVTAPVQSAVRTLLSAACADRLKEQAQISQIATSIAVNAINTL